MARRLAHELDEEVAMLEVLEDIERRQQSGHLVALARVVEVADNLGPQDAVCVLSHDHKFDVPALVAALTTCVGYVGAMGSRRTHAERLDLLRREGVDEQELARIMGPIGIDIGARSPEETAVAIVAEIIALRTRSAVPSLRDRTGPIHQVRP
jgi:xanthine dehydrogenase accessory factor